VAKPFTFREIAVALLISIASLWGIAFLWARLHDARETAAAPTISPKDQYSIATGHQAEAQIRDAMKDPDSTRFKQVLASGKAQCVVGQVTGKNSYGAYEGYKGFVWDHGKVIIQDDDIQAETAAAFACLGSQQALGDTAIVKG
jgi:hypothetical protein